MEQKLTHKHYFGNTQSFTELTSSEILASDKLREYYATASALQTTNVDSVRPDVAILKTFFIDDTVNLNDWAADWEGLKKDAQDLVGIPLVLQEDLEHPKFSVQKYFDRGTIIDYDIDEANHRIIVYVRITDPTIIERIRNGELEYVSPAVIPRGSEFLEKLSNGVERLLRTLPLHLAIVGSPAYGKDKAKMSHLCSGDGKECLHRLKVMTAMNERKEAENGDGSRTGDGEGSPNSGIKSKLRYKRFIGEDGEPALEQIPFIKKILSSLSKTASIMEQTRFNMKYPIHDGVEGHWIKAKNQDVFVARNKNISQAIKEQCGCDKL